MANLKDIKSAAARARQPAPDAAPAPALRDPYIIKREQLEERKASLCSAAAPGINVHAEIANALNMAANNLGIRASSTESFCEAVRVAVASGLGLADGYGFLSAAGNECSFVPGWKGLVELVLRSQRGTVWTGVVRKGDHFDYQLGDRPFVTHRPGDNDDHDAITYYYAIGRVNGSDTPIVEVWSVAKLIRHFNKFNKQGASHYALKSSEAMESYGRKVPLLQVLKYMPKTPYLDMAIAADAAHYAPALDVALVEPAAPAPAEDPAPAKPAAKKAAAKKPAAKKAAAKKPAAKKAAAKKPATVDLPTQRRIVKALKRPTSFNME